MHLEARAFMNEGERTWTVEVRRYLDHALTQPKKYNGEWKMSVRTFSIEDDDSMMCREWFRWENRGDTEGFTYRMRRVME